MNQNKSEFIVVVHNHANLAYNQLIRVLLPTRNYIAQVWDQGKQTFRDVEFDIIEQRHFSGQSGNASEAPFSDFEMYVDYAIQPNKFAYLKLKKTPSTDDSEKTPAPQATSLSVTGFTENNEVLFSYENKDQKINQTFGVGLFYYKSHVHNERKMANGEPVDDKFLT